MNRVEIIVAKGKIDLYEQFLYLPQLFQKLSAAEALESVCMLERDSKSAADDSKTICKNVKNLYKNSTMIIE